MSTHESADSSWFGTVEAGCSATLLGNLKFFLDGMIRGTYNWRGKMGDSPEVFSLCTVLITELPMEPTHGRLGLEHHHERSHSLS